MKFDRPFMKIKFPLATTALVYWAGDPHLSQGVEENAWIIADCEDEARSAPIDEGGCGMVSAFGDEGIDKRG